MTMVEVLDWMERGQPLLRRYGANGNYWVIAGEKCSGVVAALIRRGFVKETIRDRLTMTESGRAWHKEVIR